MWLVWIMVILAIFFILNNLKGKKEKKTEEEPEVLISDVELKHLKVYCQTCGDTEVEKGSTIKAIENKGCFSVKGFNIEGKETLLLDSKVSWKASCPCVHWGSEIGLENCVSCTNGLIRTVWVKYSNGVSFSWKIDFNK